MGYRSRKGSSVQKIMADINMISKYLCKRDLAYSPPFIVFTCNLSLLMSSDISKPCSSVFTELMQMALIPQEVLKIPNMHLKMKRLKSQPHLPGDND